MGDGVATGANNTVGVAVVAGKGRGVGARVTASTGVDEGRSVGNSVSLGSLGGFLSPGFFVGATVDDIGGRVDGLSVPELFGRSVGLGAGS